MSGDQVFSYVPVPLGETNPLSRTTILWPNNTRSFLDQTNEWNANHQLSFSIGTLNISDQWQTIYRLRVNQTGLINIFNGSTSTITFNDGKQNQILELPNLYVTVNPNTTPFGLSSGTLYVTNLYPQGEVFTDKVPMKWNLSYDGFDTVTETYWYAYRTQPFIEFGRTSNILSTNGMEVIRSTDLDVTNFPSGDYRIKVIASVPGIPPAEASGAFTKLFGGGKVSILLE
jgi:hypothetical protein